MAELIMAATSISRPPVSPRSNANDSGSNGLMAAPSSTSPPFRSHAKSSPTSIGLHFPSPSRRARNRCISCSEQGNYLDDGLGNSFDDSSLVLPDVIVTKRNRTESVSGRIEDDVEIGTVKYFCRSRGHGFIVAEKVN